MLAKLRSSALPSWPCSPCSAKGSPSSPSPLLPPLPPNAPNSMASKLPAPAPAPGAAPAGLLRKGSPSSPTQWQPPPRPTTVEAAATAPLDGESKLAHDSSSSSAVAPLLLWRPAQLVTAAAQSRLVAAPVAAPEEAKSEKLSRRARRLLHPLPCWPGSTSHHPEASSGRPRCLAQD